MSSSVFGTCISEDTIMLVAKIIIRNKKYRYNESLAIIDIFFFLCIQFDIGFFGALLS
jgi:hypothetical protein